MKKKGEINMNDELLLCHMAKYIGETVTIFTTSGGASGCGFTGILMIVNCTFVRLLIQEGTAPANPLSENICSRNKEKYRPECNLGSVCDIPVHFIASFCHNAI